MLNPHYLVDNYYYTRNEAVRLMDISQASFQKYFLDHVEPTMFGKRAKYLGSNLNKRIDELTKRNLILAMHDMINSCKVQEMAHTMAVISQLAQGKHAVYFTVKLSVDGQKGFDTGETVCLHLNIIEDELKELLSTPFILNSEVKFDVPNKFGYIFTHLGVDENGLYIAEKPVVMMLDHLQRQIMHDYLTIVSSPQAWLEDISTCYVMTMLNGKQLTDRQMSDYNYVNRTLKNNYYPDGTEAFLAEYGYSTVEEAMVDLNGYSKWEITEFKRDEEAFLAEYGYSTVEEAMASM